LTTTTDARTSTTRTIITRGEALAGLECGLQSLDVEIRTLESSLAKTRDTTRSSTQKLMDDLKARRDRFAARLRDAKETGAEAWAEIHDGLNRAWTEMETAMRDARAKLT
jgi:hypothetical protein